MEHGKDTDDAAPTPSTRQKTETCKCSATGTEKKKGAKTLFRNKKKKEEKSERALGTRSKTRRVRTTTTETRLEPPRKQQENLRWRHDRTRPRSGGCVLGIRQRTSRGQGRSQNVPPRSSTENILANLTTSPFVIRFLFLGRVRFLKNDIYFGPLLRKKKKRRRR